MTEHARRPEFKNHPARRLGGKLAEGAAFVSSGILYEIIPVFGAARLTVRAKTATAGATLGIKFVGPDFHPGYDSSPATVDIDPSGADNKVTWTARKTGPAGEKITIQYRDPSANDQALSITVTGNAIVVNLATGVAGAITSTAGAIITAIAASADAAKLVSGANYAANDGSGVVTAIAATPLAIAYANLVGTIYTTRNADDVALTAAVEGVAEVFCPGDGYAIVKLTGGGTGTVSYVDVAFSEEDRWYPPASTAYELITKHDTTNFTSPSYRGIYVGGTGDVTAVKLDGTTVLFSSVPAGVTLPVVAKRVNSTGTTATLMVALL